MADKSFGIKELNLIGASGTPTITSPNNLNLNASNVAISTDVTVGRHLDVDGHAEFDNVNIAGVTTFSSAINVSSSYGTSGQVLTSQGSGSAPQWADVSAISVARITDSKASGTDAGGFTSGAWRTRDLTAIEDDPDSIVTLSSNQFTLGAGTYLIQWSAPAYRVDHHQTRLWDVTGSTDLGKGTSEYMNSSVTAMTRSFGFDIVTLTASNTFEIQHRCATTSTPDGFGRDASLAAEKYTMVTIFKLS